jgi:hypothetical protein
LLPSHLSESGLASGPAFPSATSATSAERPVPFPPPSTPLNSTVHRKERPRSSSSLRTSEDDISSVTSSQSPLAEAPVASSSSWPEHQTLRVPAPVTSTALTTPESRSSNPLRTPPHTESLHFTSSPFAGTLASSPPVRGFIEGEADLFASSEVHDLTRSLSVGRMRGKSLSEKVEPDRPSSAPPVGALRSSRHVEFAKTEPMPRGSQSINVQLEALKKIINSIPVPTSSEETQITETAGRGSTVILTIIGNKQRIEYLRDSLFDSGELVSGNSTISKRYSRPSSLNSPYSRSLDFNVEYNKAKNKLIISGNKNDIYFELTRLLQSHQPQGSPLGLRSGSGVMATPHAAFSLSPASGHPLASTASGSSLLRSSSLVELPTAVNSQPLATSGSSLSGSSSLVKLSTVVSSSAAPPPPSIEHVPPKIEPLSPLVPFAPPLPAPLASNSVPRKILKELFAAATTAAGLSDFLNRIGESQRTIPLVITSRNIPGNSIQEEQTELTIANISSQDKLYQLFARNSGDPDLIIHGSESKQSITIKGGSEGLYKLVAQKVASWIEKEKLSRMPNASPPPAPSTEYVPSPIRPLSPLPAAARSPSVVRVRPGSEATVPPSLPKKPRPRPLPNSYLDAQRKKGTSVASPSPSSSGTQPFSGPANAAANFGVGLTPAPLIVPTVSTPLPPPSNPSEAAQRLGVDLHSVVTGSVSSSVMSSAAPPSAQEEGSETANPLLQITSKNGTVRGVKGANRRMAAIFEKPTPPPSSVIPEKK